MQCELSLLDVYETVININEIVINIINFDYLSHCLENSRQCYILQM